tara:strand:- start:637 stop:1920 length:1284 start_codon:yes stop_codon:yes gene_type:complete
MNNILDFKKEFFLLIILYFSLYLGFFFENKDAIDNLENHFFGNLLQNIGPYSDFVMRESIIENFSNNFLHTLLHYDEANDRHSPLILMYFSIYRKLGLDIDTIRLLHINIVPLCAYAFFKCLKIKFPKIKGSLLFILSLSIFLSPTMRSLSIWPDSRIYGLFFFIISIYFFIKFDNQKKLIDALFNTFFLCLAAYISPNFGLFFIFYFYIFFNYYKFSVNSLLILIANIVCALPAYYYLFELKVFFLSKAAIGEIDLLTRINLSNKILIISSIILFYFIPFFSNKGFVFSFYKNNISNKNILISAVLTFFLIFFFSYQTSFTGGGIFFQLSNLVFNNNILFFLICFLSILLFVSLWNINNYNKFILFCLIISTPQLTIYHKYFDPLLIILFFLLFEFNYDFKKIINLGFLKFLYFFYLGFLLLNYLK